MKQKLKYKFETRTQKQKLKQQIFFSVTLLVKLNFFQSKMSENFITFLQMNIFSNKIV